MKELRMWFIFVFAGITAFWLIYEIIKPNLRNAWLCGTFGAFTFLLLFSDLVAQFMVKTPGFEAMAKINQIETRQIKADSTQNQLSLVVNKILKIMELEKKAPKAAVFWGPELDTEIMRNDKIIEKEKKELRQITK